MAKSTGEDHQRFLLEKLEEQRHLLHKSIGEFAAGDLAEAVHIAVAMRVLVHETGSSKPLLKQLTGNYLELKILDRAPVKEKDATTTGNAAGGGDVGAHRCENYRHWCFLEPTPRC